MKKRRTANGTYAAVITAVMIAVTVILNLVIQALPDKYTVFDVTDTKLYSIGTTSQEVLDALEQDVTLYFLSQSGQDDDRLLRLMDNYAANSAHVTLDVVDAVADPTFYQDYTDTTPSLNSVIVASGEKSRVVDYYDMYLYSSYYSTSPDSFDGEGRITSAISYVTSDDAAKVYYTTGHQEFELGSEMTEAIEKANLELESLNLLSSEIPEDCAALIAFAPTQDFTEAEADKVRSYLADGGHALLVSAPTLWTGAETPNFDAIVADYGVISEGGVVLEGDPYYYDQLPYLLIPETSDAHEVTADLDNQNLIVGFAGGLGIEDTDEASYSVTALLSTTGLGYLKTEINGSLDQEEEENAAYNLGVAIEQTYSVNDRGSADIEELNEEEEEESESVITKVLYFTTPTIFSASALSSLIGQSADLPAGNDALFSNVLTYLTDHQASVSVASKILTPSQTTIDTGTVSLIGNIVMLLLPACVIAAGLVIFLRRRKR